jgi:hypothetical protein
MAKVTTKTLAGAGNEVEVNFARFADEIPVDVIDRMLTAEADIIEPAIVSNAETMLKGPYSTGDTAKAVFRKAPHNYKAARGGGQRQVTLTFRGVRRDKYHPNGTRNAEIAFVNEFGGRGNAARPFIQTAIDEKGETAFNSAEKVFDEWLKKEKMI